ncbi:MAG TPA: MMPL family transporter [Steroidobacteraceae bacterium]|nr:MMPL family transporter [Steroidobacteraceae bacterium]
MSVSAFHMRCGPLSKASATVKPKHSLIARLVELSAARAWTVATVAIVLCVAATLYVASNFAMTTDIDNLLSSKLGWRMRQADFDKAFPSDGSNLVVVIDGRTAELSQEAAARLSASLRAQNELFHSVRRPDAGPFWAHEGLLFASSSDVRRSVAQLLKAQPFLGSMAADPSLRGLANTLSLTMQGVTAGQATPQELRAPIRSLADAFDDLLRGKSAFFSWHSLMGGQKPDRRELRHIILVDPVLDFTQLRPGQLSVDAIRGTAKRLGLDSAHGVRVRVTGTVALEDDEFATLAQRAGLIASVATAAIILMLWFAVRSPRLIASILVTMVAGLVATTALGLALYHRFNLISVAFIPLFVGMGMDLGIQFSVRYRAERKPGWDVTRALIATGRIMGTSLILAAVAIAVGFLAFAPTEYYGVSQLGVIAGLGIIIALALALTLLPALIALTRAPGAPQKAASERLTVIDDYISRHRESVVVVGAAVAVASFVLLPRLQFDFNPMHLRSPTVESVATLDDLMHDPDLSPNTLEVIRPNLAQADQLAGVFRNDPTVSGARTLSTFIPKEQPQKIALLSDAANLLDFTLNPLDVASAPTDEQVIDSLQRAAAKLRQATIADSATRADARRLANAFDRLAQDSPAIRARAAQMIVPGFATTLGQIHDLLHPQPVTLETLPTDIVHQWLTADGRARVSILPKGDSNNDAVLRRFVTAGIRMAPDATGTAAYIQDYARAVVNAFVEAGVLSFVVIAGLLFAVLRRLRDVAITMAPIVLTGLLTMDTCVLIGQPLNFANIIALPLLFGIGVAFHIYFVMSWRAGGSHLLTSSLARGIFFSALATATGFGSLWASKHPGTASMGELLMISLIWTLASALVFQPALMSLANPKTPVRVIAAGPIFALGRSPAHQERRDP